MSIKSRISLAGGLKLSRIVHGHWRLAEWKYTPVEVSKMINKLYEWGVTTFDHADIYGDYQSETIFGEFLAKNKRFRDRIQIVTKCGIKLVSGKYPDRVIKSYDYSYKHIIHSVRRSLKNFRTDRIDLLLFHRPAPFIDPQEVNKAMEHLQRSGKVLYFGVSNFSPLQFEMLQKNISIPLVTNQVEVSPISFENFDNGNIDFFLKEKITPMVWSPLGGAKIFKGKSKRNLELLGTLDSVRKELGMKTIDSVIYTWLLKHPVGMIPIVGSGKMERVKLAVDALNHDMDLEQWYRIYNAGRGEELV